MAYSVATKTTKRFAIILALILIILCFVLYITFGPVGLLAGEKHQQHQQQQWDQSKDLLLVHVVCGMCVCVVCVRVSMCVLFVCVRYLCCGRFCFGSRSRSYVHVCSIQFFLLNLIYLLFIFGPVHSMWLNVIRSELFQTDRRRRCNRFMHMPNVMRVVLCVCHRLCVHQAK